MKDESLVKECAESLRVIRALKADELGPRVTRELDTVIQKLDGLSKTGQGRMPAEVIERVMKVLTRVAITVPLIKQVLGWMKE